MQKWIVLAAGIVLQAILGGIYAWSAFVPELTKNFGLTKGQCGSVFGLTIAIFTLAMIPAGKLLQKRGPRLTAGIGAVLYAIGHILASYSNGNFSYLLPSFGIVIGTGIGFGYVCPLTTGMKWFPDNKGLVTGVAVAGFGGGAIIQSTLAEHLMHTQNYSVMETFRFIGIAFGILAFISSLFMSEPSTQANKKDKVAQKKPGIKEKIFTAKFGLIFMGMFAGTFAGLLVIGNLKPMMLSDGLSNFHATLSISLFALGNIIGRVLWGQIHDKLGSKKTIIVSLSFFFIAMLLLFPQSQAWLSLISVILVGAGFGGCFVVYASTVVEKFGIDIFPQLYPICFLAYGIAALTGPGLGGWLYDKTNSFNSGLITSLAVILTATLIIGFLFERPEKKEITT